MGKINSNQSKSKESEYKRLASIIEFSDDAIISKDLDGKILTWNKGAERIYGYKADEIIGKNIRIILLPDRINEVSEILKKIIQGQKIEHFETKRLCKNKSIIDISLTISPIKNNKNEIIGASTIARDITKQKDAERNLDERINETEKLNKLMVGRELKMIELKEEIKSLKEKLKKYEN